MAVLDVDSEAEFDKKISSAGQKLVVIDYSTTWCGPCKVIAPKFDQLSDVYPDSVFIKVRTCEYYELHTHCVCCYILSLVFSQSILLSLTKIIGDW
jgi:thiol-disulfide isomerase/thioredoxin